MADTCWDPNGDEPVAASKLNAGASFGAADVADLETVNGSGLPNGTKYTLDSNGSVYIYDSGSSATPDSFRVVDPADSVGRFLLKNYSPEWLKDSGWISDFPSADGNKYEYLGSDGAGNITFQKPAIGPQKFTQSSHGFSAKNVIRHNGTSWVKAQGNTTANATDCWWVVSISGDDFVAIQQGRVELAGHGVTAGLNYLDASTAGALTTAPPAASATTPPGVLLPFLFVESSNVVHVLGNTYPNIQSILGQYYSSGFAANSGNPGLKIASGSISTTSGDDTITFGITFSAAPVVTIGYERNSGGNAGFACINNGSITTTGCTTRCFSDSGSSLGGGTIHWIAMGY